MQTEQILSNNLAKSLGLSTDLYLKREDQHIFGSHKGRSIPLMIKKHRADGWNNFVISSSGNSALAGIHFVLLYNKEGNNQDKINLRVFVGKNINQEKYDEIIGLASLAQDDNVNIKQVDNPKQQAFQLDKTGQAKFLRQSTDDTALLGYHELAKELSEIKNLSAVFIPTSSGTTAQGLHQGFAKLDLNPQIHIIQTTACHPIINTEQGNEASLANAIVDKVAHRKQAVKSIIKAGWMANNQEIKQAIELVQQTEKIKISPNSALSIVGLKQALDQGWKFNGAVVCLLTGR
ncbi:MAG: PLP-dependent lyase/thiolase [bacterium]